MTTKTELSPAELAFLAWQHRPRDPGPCRVCGAEMSMASSGGGKGTKYVCSMTAGNHFFEHKMGTPEHRELSDHRRASEVNISYHGDSGVLTVVEEVQRRRREAGDPFEPEVGFVYYPFGEEYDSLSHRYLGDNQWKDWPHDEEDE